MLCVVNFGVQIKQSVLFEHRTTIHKVLYVSNRKHNPKDSIAQKLKKKSTNADTQRTAFVLLSEKTNKMCYNRDVKFT
jgi:hypothetical protein